MAEHGFSDETPGDAAQIPAEGERLEDAPPSSLPQPEHTGVGDAFEAIVVGYRLMDAWPTVPKGYHDDGAYAQFGFPTEEVVAVYGAAKFLGPFLEEFAKKLGEKLGESTATALGRIRGRRSPDQTGLRIDVPLPNQEGNQHITTTLLFPGGELSDAAKQAITELDFTAKKNRGKTLRWDESIGTWWWVK